MSPALPHKDDAEFVDFLHFFVASYAIDADELHQTVQKKANRV